MSFRNELGILITNDKLNADEWAAEFVVEAVQSGMHSSIQPIATYKSADSKPS